MGQKIQFVEAADGVSIAAASEPGEVLVSDTLRGLARTSAGVAFDDRGEATLKGFEKPVRLHEVRWQD